MTVPHLNYDEFVTIVQRCTGVTADVLRVDDPTVTIEDMGVDSLGLLNVLTEVENQYDIRLDAEGVTCFPEILTLINEQLKPAAARTESSVVIDAPFSLVWDMTNDVAEWPNLFDEYASAEILHRQGATVRFRLTLHPEENGKVWSWVSERVMDRENKSVSAHRVETGPFAFMNIRWQYTQTAAGVEMRWVQEFHMKPEAPLDDAGMAERITRNSKIQMALIKERVEAAARSRRVVEAAR
jgi:aromatase